MIQIINDNVDYFEFDKSNRTKVVYGAGNITRKYHTYLGDIDFICDKKSEEIKVIDNIKVYSPDILIQKREKYVIILCVKSKEHRKEIIEELSNMKIDAVVFDFFENKSFNLYHEIEYKQKAYKIEKVNLVCQDEAWILKKFAIKMREELEQRGITAQISQLPDPDADINHFIAHHSYMPIRSFNDTLMITHVDSLNKLKLIKHQMKVAKMAICMSKETMDWLTINGVPREKVCYINPAQDGIIKPRKIVLGITGRNHVDIDHRSRADALLDICRNIDSHYFEFKIMGDGWDIIVDKVKTMGFSVAYFNQFDYEEYIRLMPSLDYYLYWGFDEGSMGFLDAVAAGIGTIVTPQGYHLDVKGGIDFPCSTIDDFIEVLQEIQKKREKKVKAVEKWTWNRYVDKHLEVWEYILGDERSIFSNQHRYRDGIYSVLRVNS